MGSMFYYLTVSEVQGLGCIGDKQGATKKQTTHTQGLLQLPLAAKISDKCCAQSRPEQSKLSQQRASWWTPLETKLNTVLYTHTPHACSLSVGWLCLSDLVSKFSCSSCVDWSIIDLINLLTWIHSLVFSLWLCHNFC